MSIIKKIQNMFDKTKLKCRIYISDREYIEDDIIKDGEFYYTQKNNIKLGNINQSTLLRDEKNRKYLEIFSPDMKKITIIKRNHEKEGIKYIIPDVGDMFTKTINETREEISDLNAFTKNLPSIMAIIILIILAVIIYFLQGTMTKVSELAGPISYLADVLNSELQKPL